MPAEIPDGAFLVARAILNSSLWTMRPQDCKLAITCIGVANWKDRQWWDGKQGVTIPRGSFVRSERTLAGEAKLSYQTTRTSLRNLENSGFLTRHSTRHYTVYTIPKYDKYQDLTRYADDEWSSELTQYPTHAQRTPNADPTHAQRTPNDKQERKERKEREEGGGSGASAPPRPVRVRGDGREGTPSGERGMAAELGAILGRNGVGHDSDESTHRPPAPPPAVQHLIGIARKVAKMPNRTETLATHLEAAAARYGAATVEQWLYDPANKGASVIILADALEHQKAKSEKLF